jgi:hypothetical protein
VLLDPLWPVPRTTGMTLFVVAAATCDERVKKETRGIEDAQPNGLDAIIGIAYLGDLRRATRLRELTTRCAVRDVVHVLSDAWCIHYPPFCA